MESVPRTTVSRKFCKAASGLTGKLVAAFILAGAVPMLQAQQRDGQAPGRTRTGGNAKTQTQERKEHPLNRALKLAYEAREAHRKIEDYSASFISQERVDGRLREAQSMHLKFRNEPFSIYLRWKQPHSGREAIYVKGKNDGKLVVHETGLKDAVAGTVLLDPRGKRAMKDNRHPVTDAGLGRAIEQMIVNWTRESRYGEIDVKLFEDKKVDGRSCVCVQIYHPKPRREFQFCLSRVYFDKQWKLPVRMENFDWPRRGGEKPELVEVYIYRDMKFNVGLTARDFDVRNPQYSFRQ